MLILFHLSEGKVAYLSLDVQMNRICRDFQGYKFEIIERHIVKDTCIYYRLFFEKIQ